MKSLVERVPGRVDRGQVRIAIAVEVDQELDVDRVEYDERDAGAEGARDDERTGARLTLADAREGRQRLEDRRAAALTGVSGMVRSCISILMQLSRS